MMTIDDNKKKILRRLFRNPLTVIGFVLIVTNLIMVLFAPYLAPYNPEEMHLMDRHTAPCLKYLLGTDFYGRDILSRIIYGSRISFTLGVSVVAGGLLFGTVLGLIAGYFGGRVDSVVMRFTDVFLAFPQLVFAMAIMSVRGQGFGNVVIALTITGWTAFARLARAEALSLRSREFVQAAQSLGAGSPRILFRHLLPNLMAPIIIQATMGMATPILTEAALTFLGIGMPPNIPSWGGMLSVDRDFMESAWWSITFPGLAIAMTVLGFNLFGDGLRDALDPKLKS
jgi:peptide/nickel transport system permease protein